MGVIELLLMLSILASAIWGTLAGLDAGLKGALLGLVVGAAVGWLAGTFLTLLVGASIVLVTSALAINVGPRSPQPPTAPADVQAPPSRARNLLRGLGSTAAGLFALLLLLSPLGLAWLASRVVQWLVAWLWGV